MILFHTYTCVSCGNLNFATSDDLAAHIETPEHKAQNLRLLQRELDDAREQVDSLEEMIANLKANQ